MITRIEMDSPPRYRVAVGDVHGDWVRFLTRLRTYSVSNSNIFQVGDWGVGFNAVWLEYQYHSEINDYCVKNNCHLYIIRGNHDNPAYFSTPNDIDSYYQKHPTNYVVNEEYREVFEGKSFGELMHGFSNITFVPDWTHLVIREKHYLMVGGAISIDKYDRIPYVKWFPKEPVLGLPLENVEAYVNQGNFFDYVLTHTAPSSFAPLNADYHRVSQFVRPLMDNRGEVIELKAEYQKRVEALRFELYQERQYMEGLYRTLRDTQPMPPQTWLYGHFHFESDVPIEMTRAMLLNIHQFKEF